MASADTSTACTRAAGRREEAKTALKKLRLEATRAVLGRERLVELMQHVREEVFKFAGVRLEPEIKIYPKGMVLVDDSADEDAAAALRKMMDSMKSARGETED